jgi:hypothetical protein
MVERQRAGDGFYFLVVGVPCLVLTAIALTVIFTHEPPVASGAARPAAPVTVPIAAVVAPGTAESDGVVVPPSVPASTLVARAPVPPPALESTPPPPRGAPGRNGRPRRPRRPAASPSTSTHPDCPWARGGG